MNRSVALLGGFISLFSTGIVCAAQAIGVVYVNGIQNTRTEALESGVAIQALLDVSANHTEAKRDFSVTVIYNPVGFSSDGNVLCKKCLISDDRKELFIQKTGEEKFLVDFEKILAPHNESTIVDREAALRIKVGFVDDLTPGDNSLEKSRLGRPPAITDEIMAPNSLVIGGIIDTIKAQTGPTIVIGHSQGNLLINLAYASLAAEFGQEVRRMLRVVNVANTSLVSISRLSFSHQKDAALYSSATDPEDLDFSLETLPLQRLWFRTTPSCNNGLCKFGVQGATFGGVDKTGGTLDHAFVDTYLSDTELPVVIDQQGVIFTAGKLRFMDRFEDFVYAAAASLDAENPPPATNGVLDTGVSSEQCYQSGGNSLISCLSVEALSLSSHQDGMTGRDVTSPDSSDGKLGFNYVKLDGNGAELPRDSVLWDCVRDRVTGRTWEHKYFFDPNHLRADSKRYSNFGDARVGDASEFVAQVNALGLCGYRDWRLPNVRELQEIVDYGRPQLGTFSVEYFLYPSAPAQGGHEWWSSDVSAVAGRAYTTTYFGSFAAVTQSSFRAVRLVRGTALPGPSRFVISTDGNEVSDTSQGLVWKRCLDGLNWAGDQNKCVGAGLPIYDHQGALERAREFVGWRLPSIKELTSLVSISGVSPAVDETIFPGFSEFSNVYPGMWSSTPKNLDDLGVSSEAWVFDPTSGIVFSWKRTTSGGSGAPGYPIRLVRSIP